MYNLQVQVVVDGAVAGLGTHIVPRQWDLSDGQRGGATHLQALLVHEGGHDCSYKKRC